MKLLVNLIVMQTESVEDHKSDWKSFHFPMNHISSFHYLLALSEDSSKSVYKRVKDVGEGKEQYLFGSCFVSMGIWLN